MSNESARRPPAIVEPLIAHCSLLIAVSEAPAHAAGAATGVRVFTVEPLAEPSIFLAVPDRLQGFLPQVPEDQRGKVLLEGEGGDAAGQHLAVGRDVGRGPWALAAGRSEEHTSELQ